MFAATVMTSVSVVVVPDAGLRVSHEADWLALQLNVPPPVLVMLMVWGLGFDPPSMPVKVMVPGSWPVLGVGVGIGEEVVEVVDVVVVDVEPLDVDVVDVDVVPLLVDVDVELLDVKS